MAKNLKKPSLQSPELPELSADERERYSRHLLMPSLGIAGVTILRSATVVVVGAGGIAQTLLTYLTTSGIGTIIIIDFDHIERTNLARQFLFSEADLGKPKAAVAAKKLSALNRGVKIIPLAEKVTAENFTPLLAMLKSIAPTSASSPSSFIWVETVDTTTNKLLLHNLALAHGITLIHGAALGEEGELLTIMPNRQSHSQPRPQQYQHTCLYCYFPKLGTPATLSPTNSPLPPQFLAGRDANADSCAVEGVLAPACGLIGSLQAIEVIRVLTSPQNVLTQNLLHIYLPTYRFRLIPPRVSHCHHCGYTRLPKNN